MEDRPVELKTQCVECGTALDLEMERDAGLCVECQKEKALTDDEKPCTLELSVREAKLFNTWFDSLSDTNSKFLEKQDYQLGIKIKNYLGIRVSVCLLKEFAQCMK